MLGEHAGRILSVQEGEGHQDRHAAAAEQEHQEPAEIGELAAGSSLKRLLAEDASEQRHDGQADRAWQLNHFNSFAMAASSAYTARILAERRAASAARGPDGRSRSDESN